MNLAIHIRPATTMDIATVSAIIRSSFRDVADRFHLTLQNCPKHPSNCEDTWVAGDMQKGIRYYLLEYDEQPAGCVALAIASPTTCYVERLAVLPQLRRMGLGESLVHQAFTEAKKLGATRVTIAIIADHCELKNWYQCRGFAEQETRNFPHLPFRVMFLTHDIV